MSVPVELGDLARRIEEFGEVAYLVTVSAEGLPHTVSVRVGWDEADLIVGAGRRTAANVGHHPDVALLWPAPPGTGYSLIVDGRAVARAGEDGPTLAIGPVAAVLHRTPEGDPAAPSCITVLPRR
jgi:hypothetical protein